MRYVSLSLIAFLLLAVSAVASSHSATVIAVPEYRNKLERVVLSLPAKEDRLVYQEDLLKRFPEYSKFYVLVAEDNFDSLKKSIEGKPYADRVELVPYPVQNMDEARYFMKVGDAPVDIGVYQNKPWPQGSVWARDAFVSLKDGKGDTWIMVPSYTRHIVLPLVDAGQQSRALFDNDYLLPLRDVGVRMQKNVPLVFKGGNVMFDIVDGETVAFIGLDEINASLALARKIGSGLDKDALRKQFAELFGVDRVVILGNGERQPEVMFHLDQAMVLLPGKVAGVVRPVGSQPQVESEMAQLEEAGLFLHELRTQLKRMGYKVFDLDVSMESVVYRRFPNPVVFTDKESGKLNVFLSAYEGGSQRDISHLLRNLRRLKDDGFDVDVIWTNASQNNGGVHCLFNSI